MYQDDDVDSRRARLKTAFTVILKQYVKHTAEQARIEY